MKRLLCLFGAILACLAPSVARPAAMSSAMYGAGPRGYDFLIGTWTCKNSVPSTMGGPAQTTLVIANSVNGALSVHVTGSSFEALGFVVYAPKTKTWWNPSTSADGGYGTESTRQTGKKTTWSGPFTDPSSGKTMQVRDTYTFTNPTTYTDLFQVEANGTWKTEGNTTCTKG